MEWLLAAHSILQRSLSMTPLRQRTSYLQQVSLFARYFNKSTEGSGPEDIRSYQVCLTNEKKLAPGSILIAVAALRFVYRFL
jgi:hypothetical protein